MDLCDKFRYADCGLKIKYPASESPADDEFGIAWDAAVKDLETYHSGKNAEKDILEGLQKNINDVVEPSEAVADSDTRSNRAGSTEDSGSSRGLHEWSRR